MCSAFVQVSRYLGWTVFGATLLAGTFFLAFDFPLSREAVPFLAIVGIGGAISFLLLRVGIGLAIREPAGADRMTGMVTARIVVGGLLGRMAGYEYERYAPIDLVHLKLFEVDRGWWLLTVAFAGACAMVLTGWLFRRTYWRVLLPLSWVAVFVLLTAEWLALYKELAPRRSLQYHIERRIEAWVGAPDPSR